VCSPNNSPKLKLLTCPDLILVDPPLVKGHFKGVLTNAGKLRPSKLCLWLPYAGHPKGLPVPQTFEEKPLAEGGSLKAERPVYSLFNVLVRFCNVPPYYDLLFASNATISPGVFTGFLSQAAFRQDLDHLNAQIKSMVFEGLKSNNIQNTAAGANDRLLDLQYDVDSLRNWLRHAVPHMIPEISASTGPYRRRNLIGEYKECIEQTNQLEQAIVNASQLFMSSLSVIEARYSTTMTQLAIIYLPLSVATGIFGMNVKEINDSSPSVWVVVVTLAILGLATFALYSSTKKINQPESWKKLMISMKRLRSWEKAKPRDVETQNEYQTRD
jgi:hypothetical protein